MSDVLFKGLPKWPALVVVGKKVTEKQAAEIIIRTDVYKHYPSSNTGSFDSAFQHMFGRPYDGYRGDKDPVPEYGGDTDEEKERNNKVRRAMRDADDALMEKLKDVRLSYLSNHQICSSYIGGPHGWCSWSGKIFCSDYNIGKWPSCEEVLEDWKLIAEAFPFLELKSQLFNQEYCEDVSTAEPVIEYVVSGGKAEAREPEGVLSYPTDTCEGNLLALLGGLRKENGISIEDLESKIIEVFGKIPQWECPEYDEWLKENV